MCIPVLLFALSGYISPKETPHWLNDYAVARQQGQAGNKPLAVFVGYGRAGWEKLAKEGRLGKEVERTLAAHYICVYVDTNTKPGRRLAAALEVDETLGIVISDPSGDYMAFHHDGDLANQDLERYLKRYADPALELSATETNPSRMARQSEFDQTQSVRSPASTGRRC